MQTQHFKYQITDWCNFQVIESLPKASQHLVILLFGTLSRTLSHAHENGMTAESLAVSIAPSVITTCTKQPLQISEYPFKRERHRLKDAPGTR